MLYRVYFEMPHPYPMYLRDNLYILMYSSNIIQPEPSGRTSKGWVEGCSLAEIAGSNPAGGLDVWLL